jgi:ribosomal protein S18 acetylase RimI-like enzyme
VSACSADGYHVAEGLLASVEDASLNASAPPQQRWLDGWLLRLSPGKAKRARCVHALAEGRRPLREKLAEATVIYQAAGLPLCFRITPFCQPPGLDAQLAALGFDALDPTKVMLCERLPTLPIQWCQDMFVQQVTARGFAQAAGSLRGSDAAAIEAHASRLEQMPARFEGWLVKNSVGEVLASGQLTYETATTLAGLYDIVTAPAARGQGIGSRLCQHLLARAAAEGVRHAYLQVDEANAGARRLYARFGFQDLYTYHYRMPPLAGSGSKH